MTSVPLNLIESFETLPNDERRSFAQLIENQFSLESGDMLFDLGTFEEQAGNIHSLNTDTGTILLTGSALRDLESHSSQGKLYVTKALANIPIRLNSSNHVALSRPNGFVFREEFLRVVFRLDHANSRVVVMAIANAKIDPLGKVWKYFKQSHAEDLLRSSELFFCRADCLTADPFECRQPIRAIERHKRALEEVFPGQSHEFVDGFEFLRESSYVCCWTRREQESYLAWKHYCQTDREEGGFALQTTERQLFHLHAKLRSSHDIYCRHVGYLDYWLDDFPTTEHGEEIFWKADWFSDEREIRLALIRHLSGTYESIRNQQKELPKGERIFCDLDLLTSSIVFNPFGSTEQHNHIKELILEFQPELESRIRASVILKKPPLEQLLATN
jgi:hypothetical protein